MKVSKFALAISLAAGGGATGAVAQSYGNQQQAQQPPSVPEQTQSSSRRRGRQQPQQEAQQPAAPTIPREELLLIQPINQAVQAQNWEAATAALPAAQAGVQSAYGKFVIGQLQLQIGRGTNNQQLQMQAVDAMLASNGAPESALPALLGARASFAVQASDWPTAERLLTQLTEGPSPNADRLRQLAEVKIRLNKNAEALAIYQRLLQLSEAGGQPATEENIKRTLEIATVLRSRTETVPLMQRLLRAYPTQANWTESLVRLRALMPDEVQLMLDVRRLMRTAGAFSREGDYLEFAGHLTRAGQPSEVKSLLEEGISRGLVNANSAEARQMMATSNTRIAEDRPTLPGLQARGTAAATANAARIAGDTLYAYGQYADAAAVYRAALQKSGADADLLNIRLGAALVAANQPAEAQAAFRAVTAGPRADLAAFWLLWLERRPS